MTILYSIFAGLCFVVAVWFGWVSLQRKPEEAEPTIKVIRNELIPKVDDLMSAVETLIKEIRTDREDRQ